MPTFFDKLWDSHVVCDLGDGWVLLHVDRHLLHDLSGPPALADVAARGLRLHNPELAFATPDHAVSSQPGRTPFTHKLGGRLWTHLRDRTRAADVKFFDLGQPGQGIVHVIGPELGLVLPGLSVVCGDSHTPTNGALGALAWGIGSSESSHALATQTLRMRKPRQFLIECAGSLAPGVTSKDLALYIISKLGTAAGAGHAIEFAGSAIESMEMEARFTLCNLSVELGARFGVIAPDERTLEFVRGRRFAPQGPALEAAEIQWRQLATDTDASFDRTERFDASLVRPVVTWGTSPEQAIPIDARVPFAAQSFTSEQRDAHQAALDYMGLEPGKPIQGTPIDWVFIGSCANARLSDLKIAADAVRGKRVASHVTAWVVPGSEDVRRQAEDLGLRETFEAAGFAWRAPGCSMCVAANGEQVSPGLRCVSTSNRNFVGRQGPGARTHLASPWVAAMSAIAGAITH